MLCGLRALMALAALIMPYSLIGKTNGMMLMVRRSQNWRWNGSECDCRGRWVCGSYLHIVSLVVQLWRVMMHSQAESQMMVVVGLGRHMIMTIARVGIVGIRLLSLRVLFILHSTVLEPYFHLKYLNMWIKTLKPYFKLLTCLSVRFKFRANSQRFCFETYALNKNSFSSSRVWNLEYGLRFLRTVTAWLGHSLRGFDGVTEPMPVFASAEPESNNKMVN